MQYIIKVKNYSTPINLALLVVRILVSIMMLTHGDPKFIRLLDGNLKFGDPIGLGSELSFVLVVFAEFFCSILIIVGLGTRLAIFPLLITMLVALLVRHGTDPIFDHVNILAYIATYVILFFTGSGKYSLDYKIFHRQIGCNCFLE
ncbi:MAG: DoxX family protein [Cyclobacteriaceae bacterium]|nr:DoxX family protein [Cyclobacteriaceae bacterium]